MERMNSTTTAQPKGRVALIGAGPGDPELLTVKAFRLLREADVVLFDNLVGDAIIELAASARRIDVGKIGGGRRTSQDVINRLLLQEARAGHVVVRLKGGDPFVFGRGGEEALYLAEHGIEVETVPGISSSIAAAAAADIPVTHRGVSTHFSVVTAVGSKADESALEEAWRQLAAAGGTVVFMMGLGRIERIVAQIRAAGVPEDRPMAVISSATPENEHVVTGTVANIVERAAMAALPTPATIVLGDVIRVRERWHALRDADRTPHFAPTALVG